MKGGRVVPVWQQRLLHVCLTVIVVAVFSALALAPFVLSKNMETADTTSMRNEMFELHLGIDALHGALLDWQAARAMGGEPDESLGLLLDERTQLLAHRIGVVLAYPGAMAVLPENAETLERTRDRVAALVAQLGGPAGKATAARDRVAGLLGPDLVQLDRYLVDAFRRLGQITANDRWQLARISLIAQRLASFLLLVGVLTLIVLWMQHRVLRRAETSLNTVMGDLAEAQRIAHIGNVRRDYGRDTVSWSPEFATIYGLDPDGQMTGAQFEALLLPADAEKVLESERKAFARSAETRAPVRRDLTFRALRADGEVIELEVQSELTANPDGTPHSMVSTVRDITVEARARRALRESERSLAAAQRIAHLGSFRHNYSTGRTSWSSELYVVLGCDPAEGPRPLRQIVHPEDFGHVQALFTELLKGGPAGGQRQASFDCRVLLPDGRERFIRGTAEMNYDDAGAPDMLTGSLQDVTTDIEQERALRDALSEAERANAAKSDFLAVMSHELRTPMNGVLGMLSAVEATPLDDRQRGQIRVARTSAEALLAILNDVLDMSKIESGRMELEERPFELRPLVTGVVDLYSESARAKGVALTARIQEELPAWITGDPLRIRQILANLVSNAVKFTHAGQVSLTVDLPPNRSPQGGRLGLRFCVSDTGIGIPVDRQQQVFGRFNQLDASYTRRFGGSGLGLAISRSLAELMGGRIGFASMPGQGSSFWLDVEAAPAEPAPDAHGRQPEGILPPLSVLVAEDNATNRLVARSMLERLGQEVAFAEDGLDALEAVSCRSFDLVLMDISMPRMDGIEATRRIRRLAGPESGVPILALTAHAGAAERTACLEAGCNEVLTKPLDLDALHRALQRWLPHDAQVAAPSDDGCEGRADDAPEIRLADLAGQIGPEAMPLLIEASREDLARHRATIEKAAAGQAVDAAAVLRACHSLVGIAATLGLPETADAARRHEAALRASSAGPGDLARLLDLIRGMEAALSRAAASLGPVAETAAP
ncbi:hybrid sensor histidine kinase/response regulator [Paracoccus benzoatiresistens]|uniref:histidine kinase n=1 Tax=Paracoccus benzoatiresistens TaxID=2997341 RepID=A0ABT4J5F3_9RHOB|nr:hybrid sensor histidine kinase/response regulator [Paracoccus sp. EF6]MCZ0961857.1 ATP-binding protein [Paracoccus sp. EF6]